MQRIDTNKMSALLDSVCPHYSKENLEVGISTYQSGSIDSTPAAEPPSARDRKTTLPAQSEPLSFQTFC